MTPFLVRPVGASSALSYRTWQSSASSTFALILTLLAVKTFSKTNAKETGKDGRRANRFQYGRNDKPKVDMAFVRRIMRLLRVMVPGVCSLEAGCLAAVAILLMARTSLDVVMVNLTTRVERSIVGRDKAGFTGSLSRFAQLCVPVALVNSLLKYFQSELSLRFRQRLTEHVFSKYMEGFTFYAVSNLDDRISNADQAITQDIERFADSLSELYSNITKPIMDIVVYVRRLSDTDWHSVPLGEKLACVDEELQQCGFDRALYVAGDVLGKTSDILTGSGWQRDVLPKPTMAYTAMVAHQEGEYRYINSRLIANAQEIAFYKGNKKEDEVLRGVFQRLVALVRRSERFRHSLGVLDSVVAKYFATIVGWWVVSRSFVNPDHPRHKKSTLAEVYQDFHSSGKMMLNLSSALGRLVLSGRELARLSGFSSRVTGLMDVIEDVNGGVHQRRGYQPSSPVRREVWGDASEASTSASGDVDSVAAGDTRDAEGDSPTGRDHGRTQVGEGGRSASGDRVSNPLSSAVKPGDHRLPGGAAGLETPSPTSGGSGQDGIRSMMGQPELAPEVGIPGVAGDLEAVHEEGGGMVSSPDVNRVMEGNGRPTRQGSVVVKEDRVIEFQEVPLVTPSGDVLIKSLSFKVEAGMNVLVAGPNGSGKSSLFRVLGGLWPLKGGTLIKPPKSRLFYVPQRPYLVLGTLRDQVIYPHTREEAVSRGASDDSLLSVLQSVRLEYLLSREGGWDSVRDWTDVLSGGEKQRLALSRLFYHRPQFAILDECTSAVSVDVEGAIYSLAARSGITLFTVSHRKSLWQYHSFIGRCLHAYVILLLAQYLLRFDGLGGYEFKRMVDIPRAEETFGS